MIYINQSINLYLAAHLSISSRQKKVFIASSFHACRCCALKRTAPLSLPLSFSLRYLFRKKILVANVSLFVIPLASDSISTCDLRITVALLLLLFSFLLLLFYLLKYFIL